ncbi:glycosyltransferase [Roseibium salinum]|nr:glycosyltransferase [Roseibium salinum]
MQRLWFAYPGDIDTPTGGYGYDRNIVAGLRELGWRVELLSLGEGFPFPSAATLAGAQRKLLALPKGALVVVDGLALGVMPEAAAAISEHLTLVALVHHPLCQENGLAEDREKCLVGERNRSAGTCPAGHRDQPGDGAAGQRPDRRPGGQDRRGFFPGTPKPDAFERRPSGTARLLSVGTVVPRKGYDLLLEALAGLADLDWHLEIVGGLEADPACYRALLRQAQDLDLAARVTFRGAVRPADLAGFYQRADIFVLASRYEGYGMAYTEALAYGLPVIGSGGGAVRETLPKDAAIYCGTGNVDALQEALKLVICDQAERVRMTDAARIAAAVLPTWQDAAAQFAGMLREVAE